MNVYTPDGSRIVHYTYVDMSNRQITRPVHLVQYDDALPVIAVKLYNDGQKYTIPDNATVNIRCGKTDGKIVYNPALGCDSSRHVVYFEVTAQMTLLAGDMTPVIEIELSNGSACSGAIALSIDYNPVQNDNIRSTNEYLTAKQYAEQAVDAAARAYNSASQADSAKIGANSASDVAQSAAAEAQKSAVESNNSASLAATSASDASASSKLAEQSKQEAQSASTDASASAQKAQQYAVGKNDSAKYYYEQAKAISEGFTGALRPMGTITFSQLPSISDATAGDMYNISDEFITTIDFKEGDGRTQSAGTNVYKTVDGYWDCLAGTPVTGIKGAKETTFRRGNVNITASDVGAVADDGDASNTTVAFTESTARANISTGEKLSVLFGKVKKWFSDLKPHAFKDTVNNLTTTATGSALDAAQGKVLNEAIAKNAKDISALNSNLSQIGELYQFTLGSQSQEFVKGLNIISVHTQLPAGRYLFTLNGVHESKGNTYDIYDVLFTADNKTTRIYYGGQSTPLMSLACVHDISAMCDIKLSLYATGDYTTHSTWGIQAVKLR